MAEAAAYRQALLRCGLNPAGIELFRDEGYTTAMILGCVDAKQVKASCESIRKRAVANDPPTNPISIVTQAQLLAFHHWYMSYERIQKVPTPAEINGFTVDVMQEHMRLLRREGEETPTVSPKIPMLKDGSDWRTFKESMDNYLSTKTGKNGIPLTHVIRKNDIPLEYPEDHVWDTEHSRLVALARHTGSSYNEDNGLVWAALKEATIEGSAWNYIAGLENRRDGRRAWKALLGQYEGAAFVNTQINEAEVIIDTTKYKGQSRNWTFAKYSTQFLKAFRLLDDHQPQPLNEQTKVRKFINGIEAPSMAAAVAQVRATPDYLNDFERCRTYLGWFIKSESINSVGNRNMSEVHSRPKKRKSTALTKRLSRQEWNALSDAEKDEVRAARARNNPHHGTNNNYNITRNNARRNASQTSSTNSGGTGASSGQGGITNRSRGGNNNARGGHNRAGTVRFAGDDEGSSTAAPPADNAGEQFGPNANRN